MKLSHPWVAVVDDEAPVRRALYRLLRSAGIEAHTFDNGAAFLDAIADRGPCGEACGEPCCKPCGKPFCVVLDLHMPGLSGLEVLARLARDAPAIPVIVVTGDDSALLRQQAMRTNPLSYLNKPMSDQSLLEAVMLAAPRADGPQ
ncbi:MAG: response regulator [Burkholderiaceae bacterium]|nr:response regulator [Burkholderiaceae bacterium]